MSLHTSTTPPLPPGTPPLPPLNANTHAGVLPASALFNLASSQNANVGNLVDKCFATLPEMDMAKFLGREAPLTKQTAAPYSQWVYLRLARQRRWTALPKALFRKAPRGGAFFPHPRRQHDVHIIVILIVINIFFSSFNDVDLLRSMSADCCMPRRQEWGTMAAVGGLRPPWLACAYFS
jgi:hypothetical protein